VGERLEQGRLVAMYSSWVYESLTSDGKFPIIPLPNPLAPIGGIAHKLGATWDVPHIPTFVSLGSPLSTWPAIAVTFAAAGLCGLLMEVLLIRPLRSASQLVKAIVTVGILLTLTAAATLRFGSTSGIVRPILSNRPFSLAGIVDVPLGDVYLVVASFLLAGVLAAAFKWSRFGLRTRAAAQNEKGAAVLGFSAESLAAWNWVIATAVSALVGIFAASVNQSVDVTGLTLLVVPALAASLLGGFESFGLTVAAGLLIGMSQSWLETLGSESWFPRVGGTPLPGVQQLVPLLIIVAVLFIRGHGLPERGSLHKIPLPFAPEPHRVGRFAAVGVVAATAGLFFLASDWRLSIINSLIGFVLCLSIVVITGYVGQISLAQMAFAGTAAFVLSKVATSYGIPFPFAPLIAVVAAVVIGVIAGLPALRIRGVSLAVVTFAVGAAIEQLVFEDPWFGVQGVSAVPPISVGHVTISINHSLNFNILGLLRDDHQQPSPVFGLVCLAVAILVGLLIANVRRSRIGEQMLAVRANERAAAAAGINVARTKMMAFALASAVAGLGGVLASYRFESASDSTFGGLASLLFLAFAYLGGISSISGAAFGALFVSGGLGFLIMSQWIGVNQNYTTLVGGVALILTAILNPDGLAGANQKLLRKLRLRPRPRENAGTLNEAVLIPDGGAPVPTGTGPAIATAVVPSEPG
jgi:branched-chain amino acid transport system permease protein